MKAIYLCFVLSFSLSNIAFAITKLTILHTNDHHGRYWKNSNNEYGLAAQKTLIDNIRQEVAVSGGNVLLLSGGDVNTGTAESDLYNAEPDFKAMKMIGYDAMAIGNHEFDNTLSVIRQQQRWAGFPFLSANVYNSNNQRIFRPYIIKNYNGVKVAIVGFTTDETQIAVQPDNIRGIVFKSPIEEAKKIIPILKRRADVIIAVTHMGHYEDEIQVPLGRQFKGDIALATEVPGIDVIVGGHSQEPLFSPTVVGNTQIVQAYEWGKYVGRMDFEVDGQNKRVVQYRLIPVNLTREENGQRVFIENQIVENIDVLNLLTPFKEGAAARLGLVIGQAGSTFDGSRELVRSRECELGNLFTSAMMAKVSADVAIMNGGGIRASIPEGPITLATIYSLHPFGDTLAVVTIKGEKLKSILDFAISKEIGSGAFAHIAGVVARKINGTYAYKIGQNNLDLNANYKLATRLFMAQGGDQYPNLEGELSYLNTGYTLVDVLIEYIFKQSARSEALSINQFQITGNIER